MPLMSDDDYVAESDLAALERAEEVRNNPSRLQNIETMLRDRKELTDKALGRFETKPRGFNNAVRSKSHA